MRNLCSVLLVAALLAAGAPPATAEAPASAPEPSLEIGDALPSALAVATGALTLLNPLAIAGALASFDTSLPGTQALVEVAHAARLVRDGTIACPVPHRIEIADDFGEARGSHRHAGVDIRAPHGAVVAAVRGALVESVAQDGAYGLTVVLRDGTGTSWLYAHLSATTVRAGESVRAGDVLGAVGCTGRCSGPHLHLEEHRGDVTVDPFEALVRACRGAVPAGMH